MAVSKKSKKVLLTLGGVLALFVVLTIVNWFVYPFTSTRPNFADVESTFNKLQIPSDWKVIDQSENRGIAGRQCPVESDGCFSKGKRFSIPFSTDRAVFIGLLKSAGCISPSFTENQVKGGPNTANYECMAGSTRVSGSLIEKVSGWEASIYVGSR